MAHTEHVRIALPRPLLDSDPARAGHWGPGARRRRHSRDLRCLRRSTPTSECSTFWVVAGAASTGGGQGGGAAGASGMGQDPEKEIKKVTTETNKIVEKNIVKEVNGVPLTPPVIAAIATPVALVALFAG
ncbi:unnamed protein product, partial [Prorocentrum cordatum]